MKIPDSFTLIDIMAFSKMHVNDGLTAGECITIHQHINGRGTLSERTWVKIREIMDIISKLNWTKPEVRYDEDRELRYYNQDREAWLKVSDIE